MELWEASGCFWGWWQERFWCCWRGMEFGRG